MGRHNQRVGSRRQVWNGTAMETSGGLKRGDLFKDKYGNLKSKKASKKAKRSKNLKKAGYTAIKGKFGAVRISGKPVKSRKASKKRKSSKKRSRSKRRSKKIQRGGQAATANPHPPDTHTDPTAHSQDLIYNPTQSNLDNEMAAWINSDYNVAGAAGTDYRADHGSHDTSPTISLSVDRANYVRDTPYSASRNASLTEGEGSLFTEPSAFQGTGGPTTRLSLINTNHDANRAAEATAPSSSDEYRTSMNVSPSSPDYGPTVEGTDASLSVDENTGILTYTHGHQAP